MSYYHSRMLDISFEDAIERATNALKREGFGVLTEIDVTATFKKKLNIDFRPYRILGACNPKFAHKALTLEDKVGTMLPCNVIVQKLPDGRVEVAAVDPIASMSSIDNPSLGDIAVEVNEKLQRVIESL